jgi:hypothetical protein
MWTPRGNGLSVPLSSLSISSPLPMLTAISQSPSPSCHRGHQDPPRRTYSSLRRHAGRPQHLCTSIRAAGEVPPLLQSSIPAARAPILDAWSTGGQIEPRHLILSHPELEHGLLPAKSSRANLSPNPPASGRELESSGARTRWGGREECSLEAGALGAARQGGAAARSARRRRAAQLGRQDEEPEEAVVDEGARCPRRR